MMPRVLPTLLAFVLVNGVVAADATTPKPPPPTLAEELAKHALAIEFTDGSLHGPGAELIAKEAAASQFVLVGEDHGLAEMPRFTAALFALIRPAGYRHLAVEIGPLVAAKLGVLAAATDAMEQFSDFSHTHPYAAPFYQWREEAAMMERVVKSMDGTEGTVWGLDQEFIGSGSFLLEQLEPLAPDDAARALIARHLVTACGDLQRMIDTHDSAAGFVIAVTPAEIAELRQAFADAGPAAATILNELERTNTIYRMNGDGRGWTSNFERARLAKEHFRREYDLALASDGGLPRVLFKYGAMHMRRGRSMIGVHDLGNLASELAEFNGLRSFHILVVIARGTVNQFHPFAGIEADKNAPYSGVDSFDGFADVKPLIEAADPVAWTLLDVRPVRRFLNGRYRELDRGLLDCLWGYDAVLIIPDGTASTLF